MSLGLKVWLGVWGIVCGLIMSQNLVINGYADYIFNQFFSNTFIFAPMYSILFGSILFQLLQNIFKKLFIPGCITILIYFIVLFILLPYKFGACILLGLLVAPIGLFHLLLSIRFFGNFEG